MKSPKGSYQYSSDRLAQAIGSGSLSKLAPALSKVKLNLRREKPDYANIQDYRDGMGVSGRLSLIGNAMADGASSIVEDVKGVFRKEDPDALVARKLKEATPSVPLRSTTRSKRK